MKHIGGRGDTIVEVLLAIAVVSAILGGAYVSSRRSLNASQQALERSQATKLLETQLERLKSIASDASKDVFNTATATVFCLDGSNNRNNFTISTMPPTDSDNLSATPGGNYPPSCIIDSGGNVYVAGSSQSTPYYISVERSVPPPDEYKYTFTARVRWDRAGGGSRDEATIVYRLYQ